MLKVWGRPDSSNVAKVMWTIGELGLPFERIDYGGKFGGNDAPEYRAMNPHGRVPTLLDNGEVFWESNAIVRYLAAKPQSSLLPSDPVARAKSDRWMDWCSISFGPALKRLRDAHVGAQDIAMPYREVLPMIEILNAEVTTKPFIAGDHLTIGDIALGGQVHRWCELSVEKPNCGMLKAYRDRLLERPAFREHVIKSLKL